MCRPPQRYVLSELSLILPIDCYLAAVVAVAPDLPVDCYLVAVVAVAPDLPVDCYLAAVAVAPDLPVDYHTAVVVALAPALPATYGILRYASNFAKARTCTHMNLHLHALYLDVHTCAYIFIT